MIHRVRLWGYAWPRPDRITRRPDRRPSPAADRRRLLACRIQSCRWRRPSPGVLQSVLVAEGSTRRGGRAAGADRGDEDGDRGPRARRRHGRLDRRRSRHERRRRRGARRPLRGRVRGSRARPPRTRCRRAAPEGVRDDLAEVLDRRRRALDEGRPHAVAGRHERGGRTARENLDDLVDEGSFVEYGIFALAAQRQRRSEDELIERTAADGLIGGIARVNGAEFGGRGRLRGRLLRLHGARRDAGRRRPLQEGPPVRDRRAHAPAGVLFAEGGGGRPGDTDVPTGSSLTARAFALWGRLSGLAPRIAIVHGRCFAGNAALAGTADILIATEGANIGMGGPAMIEGGGLGTHAPEEIGPIDVQDANGVVDLRVADEAAAVAAAKTLLGYFQGRTDGVVGARPGGAPGPGPREPPAQLLDARGDRGPRRRGLGDRAAGRLRQGHDHGAGADRGPAGRRPRQRSRRDGRRDHQRRLRQGGPAAWPSARPSTCR